MKVTESNKDCMKKGIDLKGKWHYTENYGFGLAKGVMHIYQNGDTIEGKIIFTDTVYGETSFMIQESLEGRVEGDKLFLRAVDFDVIHADEELSYELDSWEGDVLSETLIRGISTDEQGIEGEFEFKKEVNFIES